MAKDNGATQGQQYRVDCKIDGKWFSNDARFDSKEGAVAYGECALESSSAERYRVIQIVDTDEGIGSSVEGDPSLFSSEDNVDWAMCLELRTLCPGLFGASRLKETPFVTCSIDDQPLCEEYLIAS